MLDRQAGDEVLRLQAQHLVLVHRQDQIDRLALHLVHDDIRIAERQPEQSDHAALRRFVEFIAVPERIADPGAIGIEADDCALGSDVANFAQQADAIIKQIAGAKGMPMRVLTGSEAGELASSQDRDNWKDQVNGRQTSYAGPYIMRPLADRLIEFGFLPTPAEGAQAYQVRWPQTQVLTEEERHAGAKAWAETIVGGAPVFSADEIRDKWYQMDPQEVKPESIVPEVTTAIAKAIEAAVDRNDTEAVNRLLGLTA